VGSRTGQACSRPPDPSGDKGAESSASAGQPCVCQDPKFRARLEPFRTSIALTIDLVAEAIRHKVAFGMVVFDAWYLAPDAVQTLTRMCKEYIRRLKKNRRLATASVKWRDVDGWAV
jgi:hypothetical protein